MANQSSDTQAINRTTRVVRVSPLVRFPFLATTGAFVVVILTMGGALSSQVLFQAAMWLYFLGGPATLFTAGRWPRLKRNRAPFIILWFILLILLFIAIPSNPVIYGIARYEQLVGELENTDAVIRAFQREKGRYPKDAKEAFEGRMDFVPENHIRQLSYKRTGKEGSHAFVLEMTGMHGVLKGGWYGPPTPVRSLRFTPKNGLEVNPGP